MAARPVARSRAHGPHDRRRPAGRISAGHERAGPESLLFYPSIAFVAECAFHAAPLGLAALAAVILSTGGDAARRIGFVAAALIEPAFQVVWGSAHSPVWATAFVGGHLLAFNLIGLYLFRRHGFITVYLYRIAYYAVWHVAWGDVRIEILFGA